MAYAILFFSALMAATVLPMQSEAVLVALLLSGDHPAAALVGVATVVVHHRGDLATELCVTVMGSSDSIASEL